MNKYFKLVECREMEAVGIPHVVLSNRDNVLAIRPDFALHINNGSAAIVGLEQLINQNYSWGHVNIGAPQKLPEIKFPIIDPHNSDK